MMIFFKIWRTAIKINNIIESYRKIINKWRVPMLYRNNEQVNPDKSADGMR
jgi:hypothetical protein